MSKIILTEKQYQKLLNKIEEEVDLTNYEAPFSQEGEDTFTRKPHSHKGKGAVTGSHRDEEGNITDEGREWKRNYMREWRRKKREE